MYPTLDDWLQQAAIPFSLDAPDTLNAAIDQLIASLDPTVEVLGFGEALHGGEDLLILRNRLFQRLAEAHGYSAIAIESSFPRSRLINEYVAGDGGASYAAVRDSGFSHGYGQLEANRDLIEWMREYNANPAHSVKLQFYGFDSPTEMMFADSPAQALHFVLDYLAAMDRASSQAHRARIDQWLGPAAAWENPAAAMDPSQGIGLSPSATALRLETEDLISTLRVRRPEWIAKSDASRYCEGLHYASMARQLLNYHAAVAGTSSDRIADLLGMRDAMMADNLAYMVARERGRGKVLAFAHNSHVTRGQSQMQLGPGLYTWWPAGAQVNTMLNYVVIGSAVGVSEANGIGHPEAGTLEARLMATPGPARFIPTHRGQGLPASEIAALPTRSGSMKNPSYFLLTAQSFTEFDWLVLLNSTPYTRGGPPLPDMSAYTEA